MNSAVQSWLQVAVLIVGIAASLVGTIMYQTHYIDRRMDDTNKRIDDMNKRIDDWRTDLFRYLDARFKGLEDRLERLEHPVSRP